MKKLIWLFCFLSFTINCFPQPGRLDSSFGNKGIQLTSFFKGNAGSELPINTFLQSDGKILVAFMSAARAMIVRYLQDGSLDLSYGNQGFSLSADIEMVNAVLLSDGKTLLIGQNLQTKKVVLVRYTNNGFIDSTFGKNGVVNTDPRSNLFAISGAVQEDGKIVVGGYVSSTLAVARFNSNGTLDNSFNGSGMSVPNPDVNGAIYEIAVQKDGKILAAGTANEAFALVRYNLDGSLDSGFGGSGFISTVLTVGNNINRMTIQKDGKIVIAGSYRSASISKSYFAVARINTNGSMDSSFNGNGIDSLELGYLGAATALTLQYDGKILAAGLFITSNPYKTFLIITRLNANGTLDNSFYGDGKLIFNPTGNENIISLLAQPDGKIIMGESLNFGGDDDDISLHRYNSNGTPDDSFSGDGWLLGYFPVNVPVEYNCSIVQPDGRIIAAGSLRNKKKGIVGFWDFALTRYNPDGTLDSSFGNGGNISTDLGGSDVVTSIAIQKDGKIVVAGSSFAFLDLVNSYGIAGNFALARYLPNGTLDSSFGMNGKLTTDFGANEYIRSMALQTDGKIIVAGAFLHDDYNENRSDMILARYTSNGTLDATFGNDGKLTEDFGGNENAAAVLVQPDGKILVTGTTYVDYRNSARIFVIRFTKDGTIDRSFNNDGKLISNFGYRWADIEMISGSQGGLALQRDGKILIGGEVAAEDFHFSQFFVARLQRNGAIDSSFNGKGTFAIDFAEGDNGARAVAVQPDGKILLGGYGVGLILVRLKTEGTLDSSFNRNGIQTTIIGTSSTLKGMTLYRSRLYAVGSTTLETGEIDGVIAAYQLQSATNGLCCFTGPDGQKAVCGTQVNQNNCQLSGENAFFLGTVSDCSIIDTATLCARSLTPVTLSANYVEDTKTVMLTWKMESEHKTTGYNIQRSRDGETFKTIGFISSNASGHYSFSDFYPLEEGFYKLVWFESRGFESDKVLAVALPSGKLQLLPNPTSSQVRLILKELQSHEAQVWVYDNTARIVLTLKLTKDQLPQIDVTSLVSGAYYVMVKVEGKVYTEKLLKK